MRRLPSRPIAITIVDASSPHVQIIVAQFSYESAELVNRKVSQFPARTSFLLQSIPPESAETRSAMAEIQSFLSQHGMCLEIRKAQ
ncbi:MAG: hypothetical protein WBC04_19540 [Candidatus Acidiferrales bacterium]